MVKLANFESCTKDVDSYRRMEYPRHHTRASVGLMRVTVDHIIIKCQFVDVQDPFRRYMGARGRPALPVAKFLAKTSFCILTLVLDE